MRQINLEDIPAGLIGSLDIYFQIQNVISAKDMMKETATKIVENQISYRDTRINEEVDALIYAINELKTIIEDFIVPEGSKTDFNNGVVTLLDYIDIDSVIYYSQLDTFLLYLGGVQLSLRDYENTSKQSVGNLNPTTSLLEVLTDEDFIESSGKIFVDKETPYIVYEMKYGETLQDVAEKYLGDPNRFTEIADLNGIIDSNFIDTAAGLQIKIPYVGSLTSNNPNNIVYEVYKSTKPEDLARYFYGSDLYLADGKLQTTGNGDLRTVSGAANVVSAVNRRLSTVLGTYHPDSNYGVIDPGAINDSLPFEVKIQKLINGSEYQAKLDPRVQSAVSDINDLKVEEDTIRYTLNITLIGGLPIVVPVGNIVF